MIKKPFFIIFITLFCLYRFPVEELFIALIVLLFYETALNHKSFRSHMFPGIYVYIYFFFAGLLLGIFHVFFGGYAPRNVIKHIVYVFFPVLFWMVGKNISSGGREGKKVCITGLFAAGVLVSLYDLLDSLLKILTSMISGISLYGFRSMIGAGHPLTLITVFLYIFMPDSITIGKKQTYGCIGLLTVDLFIHFSRITLLNLLIFLLYSGNMKKPVKLFKYVTLFLAGTAALYSAFPSVFHNYVDRFRNTLTEISYTREVWDHASIVTNWRGYEAYCEIRKFQSAGVLEKVMGGGFGAQLDVNGKAYLVTTEEALPFMHNGYFSVLMIWGIKGCVLFVVMFVLLYMGNPKLGRREQNFWRALVVIMAADTFFVHGPFFSASVAGMFFYLGILDSEGTQKTESDI